MKRIQTSGGVEVKWLFLCQKYNLLVDNKTAVLYLTDRKLHTRYALSIGTEINDFRWPWKVTMHTYPTTSIF